MPACCEPSSLQHGASSAEVPPLGSAPQRPTIEPLREPGSASWLLCADFMLALPVADGLLDNGGCLASKSGGVLRLVVRHCICRRERPIGRSVDVEAAALYRQCEMLHKGVASGPLVARGRGCVGRKLFLRPLRRSLRRSKARCLFSRPTAVANGRGGRGADHIVARFEPTCRIIWE